MKTSILAGALLLSQLGFASDDTRTPDTPEVRQIDSVISFYAGQYSVVSCRYKTEQDGKVYKSSNTTDCLDPTNKIWIKFDEPHFLRKRTLWIFDGRAVQNLLSLFRAPLTQSQNFTATTNRVDYSFNGKFSQFATTDQTQIVRKGSELHLVKKLHTAKYGSCTPTSPSMGWGYWQCYMDVDLDIELKKL